MLGERLERLEEIVLPGHGRVLVARSAQARLLGLAWLDDLPADVALLLPRCRSVHTFGMRFALDVTFLDGDWREIETVRAVPPQRVVANRGAAAVLERRAAR